MHTVRQRQTTNLKCLTSDISHLLWPWKEGMVWFWFWFFSQCLSYCTAKREPFVKVFNSEITICGLEDRDSGKREQHPVVQFVSLINQRRCAARWRWSALYQHQIWDKVEKMKKNLLIRPSLFLFVGHFNWLVLHSYDSTKEITMQWDSLGANLIGSSITNKLMIHI